MKFLLLLFLFPLTLLAQKNVSLPEDLAGVWQGFMFNDTTQKKNDFELAISESSRKLSGYTYTVYLIDGKKNIGVKKVKIKARKESLFIEDEKLIDNNYDTPPAKGVRTFIELHFTENDTAEILSGSWKTNITREYNSVTGNFFLERKKEPEQTAIILKLRQLNLLNQLSFMSVPIASSADNTLTGIKTPENLKVNPTLINAAPEKNLKLSALIVPTEKLSEEVARIIPDTTSTNPEITIFMFPKNDTPAKEAAKNGENEKELAVKARSPGKKKDTIVYSPIGKSSEKMKQVNVAGETVKNEVIEKEPRNELTTNSADNNSGSTAGREVVNNEVESVKIVHEQAGTVKLESLNFDKKVETAYLNPLSVGQNEIIYKSDSLGVKIANNNAITGKGKMLLAGSIQITKKNELVRIYNPVGVMNTAGIISKRVPGIENMHLEIKEGSTFAKSMGTIANDSTSELITDEMLSAREIETIHTVEIERDTLIFSLFDNGVVDGDTVSVLLNGKVIMSKIGLLARAYNDTIYLTQEMGDSIKIIMYAENLGSIAPNTGLLVVREGEFDHEIRFSGDLKKNSAIILKRKKQLNGK